MSKKIVAIIQARMTSSRLPGKVLLPVSNEPLLKKMIRRVSQSQYLSQIIIATSVAPSDNPIADLCVSEGWDYSRGNLEDVLDRYYSAATQSATSRPDIVVRLTSDCPLHDPKVIDQMIEHFLTTDDLDYLSNTTPPPGSYPDGMDIEIFTFTALERAHREAKKPSEREHVTFYFWKNPHLFQCKKVDYHQNWGDYRLTLDYQEDYELLQHIFNHFEKISQNLFSMEEIIEYLEKNPDVKDLNSHIKPNQGWLPSLERDRHQSQ